MARDHGIELVVLDVDPRAEWRLDVPYVGGGSCSPADRIQECVKSVGRIESGRLGQGDLLDDQRPRLDLPDDLQLLAECVILDGQERDQVLRPGRDRSQRSGRQCAGLDVADHPAAGADADQLARFGWIQ